MASPFNYITQVHAPQSSFGHTIVLLYYINRMLHIIDVLLFVCAVLHICASAQGSNASYFIVTATLYNR